MSEPAARPPHVTLYRCTCRHCDVAAEALQPLCARYGAVLEIRRADLDAGIRRFAGWSTPIVAIDGVGVSQFKVDSKAWEEALRSRAQNLRSTVVGVVVDMCCYFRLGANPEGHEACARECFASGGPVGVATPDGRLFLALPDKSTPAAFESLKTRPGARVRVEGESRFRDGLSGIVVSAVGEP